MYTIASFLHKICTSVGKQLGPGHSEAIYQKATSLLLQQAGIQHHCEYHAPVPFSTSGSLCDTPFHIGSERIDILIYDTNKNAHVVELKAVGASLSPNRQANLADDLTMPAAHMQLLKYIRLLKYDPRMKDRVIAGYVINFRQNVKFGTPEDMPVELDLYNVIDNKWMFDYKDQLLPMPSNMQSQNNSTSKEDVLQLDTHLSFADDLEQVDSIGKKVQYISI